MQISAQRNFSKLLQNKKVLLREPKRHTARRVVSTPSVVLTGYPLSVLTRPGWGYPAGELPYLGTPHPGLVGGVHPWPGTLMGGTLLRGYPTGVPPWQGTPILTWPGGTLLGYPPAWYKPPSRVPPGRVPPLAGPGKVSPLGVCPMEFWVMLQSIMGYGYPLP